MMPGPSSAASARARSSRFSRLRNSARVASGAMRRRAARRDARDRKSETFSSDARMAAVRYRATAMPWTDPGNSLTFPVRARRLIPIARKNLQTIPQCAKFSTATSCLRSGVAEVFRCLGWPATCSLRWRAQYDRSAGRRRGDVDLLGKQWASFRGRGSAPRASRTAQVYVFGGRSIALDEQALERAPEDATFVVDAALGDSHPELSR